MCCKNSYKLILILSIFVYLVLFLVVNFLSIDVTYSRVQTFTSEEGPDNQTTTLTSGPATVDTTSSTYQVTVTQSSTDDDNDHLYPYMAAVLHLNKLLLGAGAIVGEKWILVTAFQMGAFKPEQLRVRVGSNTPHSGGQLLDVQQLFPHPMFSQFNNDVALLKTVEDMVPSPTVQPIPVAPAPPEMGAQAALIVWNSSESRIQKNRADILPVSKCRLFYPEFELTESNICILTDDLPYSHELYGSPLVFNGSLIGHYMGLEASPFQPSLCSSLAPLAVWVQLMMTNETDTRRLFPLS